MADRGKSDILAFMSGETEDRMTVEEYLARSQGREGRYELIDGVVYAQAAERAAHADMKLDVAVALMNAIRAKKLECRAMVDGMAVRVGAKTVYEPDALVYCGPKLPGDALLVDPVVVVEVISPTSGGSSGRGSNCRSRSFTHRKKRARKAAGQARAFGLR
ncbi:MAG: hypothetical protein EKK29_04020 [Hyphomicrobiales bacterium]|nr:MAG: hypothetical protein EKK29_04020 [Hyphomicrobiales bacterium]